MNPAPIGSRIRVIANSNSHHYRIGGIYQICGIDPDGTFKATDGYGWEGDDLRWKDCERAGLGWHWLRQHLDPRSLDLLNAFEGLENLRLKPSVESRLISAIPNLDERILTILPAVEETAQAALAAAGNLEQEPDNDLDIDFNEAFV